MLRPVERSITVSAPQRIAHTILSTSSSTEEVTAELPILALILVSEFRLRDLLPVEPAQRPVVRLKRGGGLVGRDVAVIDRFYRAAFIFLDAAALLHPGGAKARQARVDVDHHRTVGVGTGGVIYRQV